MGQLRVDGRPFTQSAGAPPPSGAGPEFGAVWMSG